MLDNRALELVSGERRNNLASVFQASVIGVAMEQMFAAFHGAKYDLPHPDGAIVDALLRGELRLPLKRNYLGSGLYELAMSLGDDSGKKYAINLTVPKRLMNQTQGPVDGVFHIKNGKDLHASVRRRDDFSTVERWDPLFANGRVSNDIPSLIGYARRLKGLAPITVAKKVGAQSLSKTVAQLLAGTFKVPVPRQFSIKGVAIGIPKALLPGRYLWLRLEQADKADQNKWMVRAEGTNEWVAVVASQKFKPIKFGERPWLAMGQLVRQSRSRERQEESSGPRISSNQRRAALKGVTNTSKRPR